MKKIYLLLLLSVLVLASSCRKIIDLKVSDAEPQLVIEAIYNANAEQVKVNITNTINVFSSDTFPTIVGATVEIIDENGLSSLLTDNGDGTYTLENYTPIWNSIYKMKILLEGELYEAEDYLPTAVPIDSLSYEYQEETFLSNEGYLVFMHGSDPVGEKNYYRLVQQVNGEYKKNFGDQILFDDSFGDGTTIKLTLFGSIFEYEDTVGVEIISYSKQSYKYMNEVFDAAGGSQFSAAPANPVTNWSQPILGHFSAYGYSKDSIIVGH